MIPDFTGVHLWDRLVWAKQNLAPVQSRYRMAYEDDMDGTAKILVPDPNWMAAALHGGILPPAERYHDEPRNAVGTFIGPRDYWSSYDAVPAMSEEEAIEYLIRKDVPRHVWQTGRANRLRFAICTIEQLPATREWRNAWRLADAA